MFMAKVLSLVKTNNKYIDDVDSSTSSSYNFFLDFHNQYGYAFLEATPYRKNEWFNNRSIYIGK